MALNCCLLHLVRVKVMCLCNHFCNFSTFDLFFIRVNIIGDWQRLFCIRLLKVHTGVFVIKQACHIISLKFNSWTAQHAHGLILIDAAFQTNIYTAEKIKEKTNIFSTADLCYIARWFMIFYVFFTLNALLQNYGPNRQYFLVTKINILQSNFCCGFTYYRKGINANT